MNSLQIIPHSLPQRPEHGPRAKRWLTLTPPLLAVAALCSLTACKTSRQVTRDSFNEPSGFLVDYSQMQKGVKDRAILYYINPSASWAQYTKIWIKPVELWRSDDPDSPMGKISAENQQTLIDLFHTSMYNALSTNYTIVEQGGPDVLILHAAITEARKSKPVIG